MQVNNYDTKAIGRRLRSGLADNGMTVEQLAERIGVSRFAVQDWMSGRKRMKLVDAAKVCDVFGWPVDVLATRVPLVEAPRTGRTA